MVENSLTHLFNRSYILLKINAYFLFFCLFGGIILGIGPAIYTAFSLFYSFHWEKKGYSYTNAWKIYRGCFIKTNKLTILFLAVLFLLTVNLWIAAQLKGLYFFGLTFFLFFILVMLVSLWIHSLFYQMKTSLCLKNLLKFSLASLFSSAGKWVKEIIGSLFLVFMMWKYPGAGFFWGFGGILVYQAVMLEKKTLWFENLMES